MMLHHTAEGSCSFLSFNYCAVSVIVNRDDAINQHRYSNVTFVVVDNGDAASLIFIIR